MKHLLHILLFTIVLGLAASCSDDINPDMTNLSGCSSNDGFEIALSFPEMENVVSRALGTTDQNTPLTQLDIFLFVFDGNNLLQTIHIPTSDTTRSYENGKLKFSTDLPQTDNNAVLHIIAIDDSNHSFADQINTNGYGIEDSIMPALYVNDNKDCYWQRIDLETRIVVTVNNDYNGLGNVEGTEDAVQQKLKYIPLIRNFAQISIENKAPNFELMGWTVVNDRDRGSAVPWYSKQGDPDILYPEYFDYKSKKGKSYQELTTAGYPGVSQLGATLRNKPEQLVVNPGSWNTNKDSKFIYERKISSVNPLYILIYGKFNNTLGYYKLSLGHTDKATGLFTEYNVIRNIAYNIVIESVTTDGASTVAKALEGPAFNNISGDVVTRNMINISDGADMLYVNKTSYVVTLPNSSWDFKFRYRQNIKQTPVQYVNSLVKCEEPGVGISTGDVIKGYTIGEQDAEGWTTIHIEFNEPTDELKTQSFTIFSAPVYVDGVIPETNTMGLSRTINLVLRNPWEFEDMETFPGQHDDDEEWPTYDPDNTPTAPDVNYYIGPEKGASLTIFYKLPAGLPEAIFPLEFTFESDKQNIENAGIGTAVVKSGPSLFQNVYDHRISYVKTLRWEDYAENDGESTPASRIQRARFVTTTAIESLPDTKYITTVIIHNDYFKDATDKFERKEGQNVPDPTDE